VVSFVITVTLLRRNSTLGRLLTTTRRRTTTLFVFSKAALSLGLTGAARNHLQDSFSVMSEQSGNVIQLQPNELPGTIVSYPALIVCQAGAESSSNLQVVNVFALLSTVALLSVVFRVICLAFKFCLGWNFALNIAPENVFFRTRMGTYAACILIGNLFTSTAGVIGLRWLVERKIIASKHENISQPSLTDFFL